MVKSSIRDSRGKWFDVDGYNGATPIKELRTVGYPIEYNRALGSYRLRTITAPAVPAYRLTKREFEALPASDPRVVDAARFVNAVSVGGDFARERIHTRAGRGEIHRVFLRHKFNSDSSPVPLPVLESHSLEPASYLAHDWFSREVYRKTHHPKTEQLCLF